MSRLVRSFTIEPTIGKALDQEAERLGLTRSELVNRLLDEGIKRQKKVEAGYGLVQAGSGITALVLILTVAFWLV